MGLPLGVALRSGSTMYIYYTAVGWSRAGLNCWCVCTVVDIIWQTERWCWLGTIRHVGWGWQLSTMLHVGWKWRLGTMQRDGWGQKLSTMPGAGLGWHLCIILQPGWWWLLSIVQWIWQRMPLGVVLQAGWKQYVRAVWLARLIGEW